MNECAPARARWLTGIAQQVWGSVPPDHAMLQMS
jgi:hypothetical protein